VAPHLSHAAGALLAALPRSHLGLVMSDVATSPVPASRRNAPLGDRQHRISAKVRTAIRAMVWDGLVRKAAAQAAGLADHSLYLALRDPRVRSHYLAELEVLRTSERARNIHALVDVRDQKANAMARVQAVKALEQLGDDPAQKAQSVQSPGIVIVVGAGAVAAPVLTEHQRALDAKPLIEQGSDVLGQTVTGNDT
jgi:hypothetical protein